MNTCPPCLFRYTNCTNVPLQNLAWRRTTRKPSPQMACLVLSYIYIYFILNTFRVLIRYKLML